ncbi:response regulator [Vibrio methylphosphonaticus]|uniref:response regulator n=1 Tax=Vibrio methylphosphonaticus TaxID=2946866 RepID=UPI00202A5020|nr:response regulator [Vibrio methylphosphonaticus]MCL9773792.1 response regulator [Vibrio methylphosphonaticus]
MNNTQILVVEDEPTLGQIVCEYLQQSGMKTQLISDGLDVIDWVKAHQPDLIILDLMLPHRDGLDIYRELRTFTQVPVIMATARVDEIDRLLGLELGADDYICKPYSVREVVVRVKNVLRRSQQASQTTPVLAALHIDTDKMVATYQQHPLSLTPAEFKLLAFLHDNAGFVYSREQLMNHIYPDNRLVFDRTIDSHIKNLRKKLQHVNSQCDYIKSVYGIGYKFDF